MPESQGFIIKGVLFTHIGQFPQDKSFIKNLQFCILFVVLGNTYLEEIIRNGLYNFCILETNPFNSKIFTPHFVNDLHQLLNLLSWLLLRGGSSNSYRALHCFTMAWIALHCLSCCALYCTALNCNILYCTALYCTALHCTSNINIIITFLYVNQRLLFI